MMNHMLFKVAEIEEKLLKTLETGEATDRLVARTQLKTLEFFKYHPIRHQAEAEQLLHQLNIVFGV